MGLMEQTDAMLLQVMDPIFMSFGADAVYYVWTGVADDNDGNQEDQYDPFPIRVLHGKNRQYKTLMNQAFVANQESPAIFRIRDLKPGIGFKDLTENDKVFVEGKTYRITEHRKAGPFFRGVLKG
jgi:hypothetical protein